MKPKAIEGARYFENEAAKVGVVLFHAYTGTPMDVNLLGRRLEEAGYSVLMPKFYGHGEGVDDLFSVEPRIWFEQGEEVVEWMREDQGYPYIFAFGLSLGGMIASHVLSKKPEVIGGGIFNSPILTASFPHLDSNVKRYIQSHQGNKETFTLYQHQIQQLFQETERLEASLKDIQQPFFFAQSGSDELVDTMQLNDLPTFMPQTSIDHFYYPEMSHVITVHPKRAKFEADVLHFIDYQLNQQKRRDKNGIIQI